MMVQTKKILALAAFTLVQIQAIDLDTENIASIKSAAAEVAHGLVGFYHGNETGQAVGVLDKPYFWWESAAMFNTLIDYWTLTGDSQYNNLVSAALIAQTAEDSNFMPPNQTATLGNDDQSTWALAAMSAEQAGLPVPTSNSSIPWIRTAQNVFDNQVARWDNDTCKGGLRWQIFPFNNGYNYKNSVSNGQFFELAARLAHSSGNTTFSTWASEVYDWTKSTGLIDDKWNVFDGASVTGDCTEINKITFSWQAAPYVAGSAYMYNLTSGDEQAQWKDRLDGLLNQTIETYFPNGIATEVACESVGRCNTDMRAFKGLLGQRLAATTQVAPYTANTMSKVIRSSAGAAAKACTDSGCALEWGTSNKTSAEDSGVGEHIDALSYIQGLLVGKAVGAKVNDTSSPTKDPASGTPTSSSGTPSATQSGNVAVALGQNGAVIGLLAVASFAWML